MDLVRGQFPSDQRQKHMHLLARPVAKAREQRERVRLERHLQELDLEPATELLKVLILGPSPQRHDPLLELHVLEAGLLHHVGELRRNVEAQGGAQAAELHEPLVRRGLLLEAVVVAEEVGAALGELDGAAGRAVVVAVGDEGRPVLDGAGEGAGVDEVEVVLGECPVQGGVVNLEADIWGDPVEPL